MNKCEYVPKKESMFYLVTHFTVAVQRIAFGVFLYNQH